MKGLKMTTNERGRLISAIAAAYQDSRQARQFVHECVRENRMNEACAWQREAERLTREAWALEDQLNGRKD